MNRYFTSLSVSLLSHLILAILLFFTYQILASEVKIKEKKVKLNLCCIKDTMPIVKKKLVETKFTPRVSKAPKKSQKVIATSVQKHNKPLKKKIVKKTKQKMIKKIEIPVVKKKIQKIEKKSETVLVKKIKTKKIDEIKSKKIEKPAIQKSKKVKKQTVQTEYINENITKIVKLLQDNLYYPRSARKRGITGEVVVQFVLSTDSNVDSIKVITSNSDLLSRAAIKTIENLSGHFPKPSVELSLQIPINYTLKR